MSKGAAFANALAQGLNGYIRGAQYKDLQDRQAQRDQMAKEEHDIRLDSYRRDNEQRAALAEAAKPATMMTLGSGMVRPETMDDRDVGLPGEAGVANGGLEAVPKSYRVAGQTYVSEPEAKIALENYNKPEATLQRQAQVLSKFDPVKGISLQNTLMQGKKTAMELDQLQASQRALIENEGYVATARAAMTGDPNAVVNAFNKQGDLKVKGDLTVTPEKRKAPWGEEIETFTYTGQVEDRDGNVRPVKVNSLDAMVRMTPFQDLFKARADSGLAAIRHRNSLTEIEKRGEQELQQIGARGAQDRLTNTEKAKAGGEPVGREERLRYTTLFQDAGRRLAESQKALATLQKDPFFMSQAQKSGSAQAQELAALKQLVEQHGADRALYQGLLAKGQGEISAEGKKDVGPKRITSKAERDALPKGARYIAPDGQTYIKQ